MESMVWLYFALVGLVIILAFLYLFPRYLAYGPAKTEGFSTIALNDSDFPSCLARDYDAQTLLSNLKIATKGHGDSDEATMAYKELSLIVQKLLCMDADITSMGAGVYASLRLPFNTQHDMEQVGTFVGRCLKNAVKARDIDLTLGKLQDRGTVLIAALYTNSQSKAEAVTLFDGVVKRTKANITKVCLKEHASMDIPAGMRDPGYYIPEDLATLGPYQNTSAKYNFN
jgi:hypothetical protein